MRNRIKRGIREWFRHHRASLGENVDVVVIARQRAAKLSVREMAAELCLALRLRVDEDTQRRLPEGTTQ